MRGLIHYKKPNQNKTKREKDSHWIFFPQLLRLFLWIDLVIVPICLYPPAVHFIHSCSGIWSTNFNLFLLTKEEECFLDLIFKDFTVSIPLISG